MKRREPLFLFLLFLMAACRPEVPPADLVLRGGMVHTLDDARSRAEAVAVGDGAIVFVGGDADVEDYIGPETRVVDLAGKMVLPGFQDSHVHPVTGGMELAQCDLNGLATREQVFSAVEAYASDAAPEEWVVGGGWDLPLFPNANPSRTVLDRLVANRPAYISSADGHSAWVSTRALEIAGVDAETPDPPNGRIERDRSGNPTGTLRESAMGLVEKLIPHTQEEYVEGLKRGLAVANRFGITSLVEASAADDRILTAYRLLAEAGELTARVRVSVKVQQTGGEQQLDALVAKRSLSIPPYLRVDSAKIFADGVIEAQTAALLENYVGFDHRGPLNFEPELLDRIVTRLDREGFQVHIHAIGDRAIRVSLDAFEKAREANGVRDSRHQIAHIELFDPDDIPRFRELGVVADFQPLWAFADSYITDLTEPVLGPERSRWLYPIESLAHSGAHLAAGSDWSVSSMNPLEAMEVAVTRKALGDVDGEPWIREERVDLDTILAAYTRGGAYVQHQEDLTGSIEVGKRADLVVLDRNLLEVPEEKIHEVKALWTLLDGREVYRDPAFEP